MLRIRRGYSTKPLKRTALYDLHLTHAAKMVPFAGYEMPVLYPAQSLSQSHLFTRSKASIFDVSHMVQTHFSGSRSTEFFESITPSGIRELEVGKSTLSVLLNENGGIIDDLIITRTGKHDFYVVTNAACREGDLSFFSDKLKGFNGIKMDVLDERGLIALQGPIAKDILAEHINEDLSTLKFGQGREMEVDGVRCHVARGGYTGEDGFEISIPNTTITQITENLLKTDISSVALAGLGSRDSLRLEAGMCLYGHDINDGTTPVEASLSWLIPKRRREEGGFPGFEKIKEHLKQVPRRRVGLIVSGAPAREGSVILDAEDNEVGMVTSGCPSPSLGKNIAMGYVKNGLHKTGTALSVRVRNRMQSAVVTKMPFVETKYYK